MLRKLLDLSLTTKSTAIICVVAAVLIYIGTTTLSLSADRLQNSFLVSKQFQLLNHLDNVVIELARAEAGEREYIQTGKVEAKQRYWSALSQIDENISKLKLLFSDKTQYVMLIEDLTESLGFRKSCAEEVMTLRDTQGMEAALQRSAQFDEEGMTQHVEWLARDVSRTINDEMTERFSELDRENLNSMVGMSVILCSALLALVLVIFGINRYVRDRVAAEKSLNEAQKALTEREARMRAVVATAPDGIVTVTTSGVIEAANAVFEQMFGYERGELVGVAIENILPGFSQGVQGRGELTGGAVKEISGVKKDGVALPVELSVSAVERDLPGITVGIVRDITERRVVEERVKDFYSMVSHELRTPLASIRTALGLMESNFASDESKPVIKIASDEADRLMRLINDILDMRKIESGKIELYSDIYSGAELIQKAVEGVSSLGAEHDLTFVTLPEPGLEVFCDQDRTLQVLTNLLSNAIKYSPPGGSVMVSTEVDGNFCRFAVQDEGPGIPKNQTNKLFGRFEQLKSADGQYRSGSGLGLAIAKATVEEQGGQIGFELPDMGGSRFWFTLPLADAEDFEIEEPKPA